MIETVSEEQRGSLLVSRVVVTDHEGERDGWNVDCNACGASLATLLDHRSEAVAFSDDLGHECTTEPCGCPTHIVADEGHQEGCDLA